MLNYYQPFLLPFLRTKSYKLPEGIRQMYYYSMEDALWEFTRKKGIKKGSLFLIPDFYCVDVLNNINRHGFKYKLWKLDKHFRTDIASFKNIIKRYKPQIIILFHCTGITSNLLKDISWLSSIPETTFIIEDSVHRLVNPENITLIHKNHVIMDSLRKDSPLPGSFVYGNTETLTYNPPPFRFSRYVISSSLWFMLFRIVFIAGCLLNFSALTDFAHEKILKKHDDIIGDSWDSYGGFPWVPAIHRYFNFGKIERKKQSQILLYKNKMKKVYGYPSSIFYEIDIPSSDFKNLHVYPVGVNLPESKTKPLIKFLHHKNISVWVKFPGCGFNSRLSCLFLPVGFHVSDKEISYAADTLLEFISSLK